MDFVSLAAFVAGFFAGGLLMLLMMSVFIVSGSISREEERRG